MFGITRIDAGNTHAWTVRVKLSAKGSPTSKTFSDGVYGNKKISLQAAKKHRDKLLEHRAPWLNYNLKRQANKGVSFRSYWRKKGDWLYLYEGFKSHIYDHRLKTIRTKQWSIKKHSYNAALNAAIDQRLKWEKEIYGASFSSRAVILKKY